MNIKETKDQARALVESLAGLGIRLKHQQALEVLSRVKGAKGYSQLIAGKQAPKQVALTSEQQSILDEAVRMQVSAQGVPDVDRPVRVVMSGDVFGNINDINGFYADRADGIELSLVLMPFYRKASYTHYEKANFGKQEISLPYYKGEPYAPSVHYLSAILGSKEGTCVVESVEVLDVNEMLNRPVEIELRYNNTGSKSICPLSMEQHKPYIGIYPFLADSWDPIDREILPPRVWSAVEEVTQHETLLEMEKENPGSISEFERLHMPFMCKNDHRMTITMAEIRNFMKEQSARHDERTPDIQGAGNIPF